MSTNTEEKSPIINGVLCYTSTARHSVRHDDIVRVCLSFFKEDEIIKGKDTLCNIIGEKSKRRRNENRIMHEVRDILDILKRCDDKKCELPKFVVDSYDGLPPTSGFDLIAQSLTALNDEILALRKEIEYLKDNCIEQTFTFNDMSMIKEDLITIKGEIRKINHRNLNDDIQRSSLVLEHLQSVRSKTDYIDKQMSVDIWGADINENGITGRSYSATNDSVNIIPNAPLEDSNNLLEIVNRSCQDEGGSPSAPIDQSYQDEHEPPIAPVNNVYEDKVRQKLPATMDIVYHNNSKTPSACVDNASQKEAGPPSTSTDRLYEDEYRLPSVPSYAQVTERRGRQSKPKPILRNSLVNVSTASSLIKVQENVQKSSKNTGNLPIVDNDGFTLVQNGKKNRDNIVGSKIYSGTRIMKSARRVGDLYLGNLDLNVTENEIIEYIKEETDISIDSCIPLSSRNPNCKAFKISVSFESRLKLLLPEIWPEGVICRKFYNPRNK